MEIVQALLAAGAAKDIQTNTGSRGLRALSSETARGRVLATAGMIGSKLFCYKTLVELVLCE